MKAPIPICTLPEGLRKALKRRKMSFRELSYSSGVPVKTLYHWSSGQMPRKLDHLFRVARVLEISIEQLAFGEMPTPSQGGPNAYELVLYRIKADDIREQIAKIRDQAP